MKRLSTRCMYKFSGIRKRSSGGSKCEPRKQTLDFLTQFARVYNAEPVLNKELCSYILN